MLFCKKIGKNFPKVVDFFVERGYNTQNKKEGNLRLREDYGSFISVILSIKDMYQIGVSSSQDLYAARRTLTAYCALSRETGISLPFLSAS